MAQKQSSSPIHLMMRYSDALMGVEDTIAEHQSVIDRRGAVWIGKIGKPLGGSHIAKINRQCRDGHPTFMFLVQNRGRPGHADYVFHRGKVCEVGSALPSSGEKLVPRYYIGRGIKQQAAFWCKVTALSQVSAKAMLEYHVASSRRPIRNALVRSLAALFVLGEGKGIDY
jgi:hypothetical protein